MALHPKINPSDVESIVALGVVPGNDAHGTVKPSIVDSPKPFDFIVASDESLTLIDQLNAGKSIGVLICPVIVSHKYGCHMIMMRLLMSVG